MTETKKTGKKPKKSVRVGDHIKGAIELTAAEEFLRGILGKTEQVQKAFNHIKVNILGIGPDDEALYNKIKASLTVAEVSKLADFVEEMMRRGYSFWWFRSVMATMQQDFEMRKGEDRRDNPAVQRALCIIEGTTWKEQMKLAGPSMVQKKFRSKLLTFSLWAICTGFLLFLCCDKIFA